MISLFTCVCLVKVVCGLDHTLLLLEDGSVWACGWAADGQTGILIIYMNLACHC